MVSAILPYFEHSSLSRFWERSARSGQMKDTLNRKFGVAWDLFFGSLN